MQVELKDARPGDFVLFRGKGSVFTALSFILCLVDSQWKRLKWKPWHIGFLAYQNGTDWKLCESLAEGIKLTDLGTYSPDRYRIYRWFDIAPSQDKIQAYLSTHLGKPYDVAIYFWTALQYLIRHYWNRRIPRLLDDRYTCWENGEEFASEMGKSFCSNYDCIMITDFCKALME